MNPPCPWCPDFDPTALANRGASHVACPACLLKLQAEIDAKAEGTTP